jgi:hypothetical protein
MDGSPNLIEPSKRLFPAVSDFSIYIPAETGHGINAHFSAPEVYRTMQDFRLRCLIEGETVTFAVMASGETDIGKLKESCIDQH